MKKLGRRCCLYRHFDAEGRLLYVGVSTSLIRRLEQHGRYAHWFSSIAKITIQHFANEREALAAELDAIRTEEPMYNIQHTDVGYIGPELTDEQIAAENAKLEALFATWGETC